MACDLEMRRNDNPEIRNQQLHYLSRFHDAMVNAIAADQISEQHLVAIFLLLPRLPRLSHFDFSEFEGECHGFEDILRHLLKADPTVQHRRLTHLYPYMVLCVRSFILWWVKTNCKCAPSQTDDSRLLERQVDLLDRMSHLSVKRLRCSKISDTRLAAVLPSQVLERQQVVLQLQSLQLALSEVEATLLRFGVKLSGGDIQEVRSQHSRGLLDRARGRFIQIANLSSVKQALAEVYRHPLPSLLSTTNAFV